MERVMPGSLLGCAVSLLVGLLLVAGCQHHNQPATSAQNPGQPPPAAATNPVPPLTPPAALADPTAVRRQVVGTWMRSDGAIRATFTDQGGYELYVVQPPATGAATTKRPGRANPPLTRTSQGTFKLVDAAHIQFTTHGKSMTNGVALAGNQLTLTNPDGTVMVWSRQG